MRVVGLHVPAGGRRLLEGCALGPYVKLALRGVGAQPIAQDEVTGGLGAIR